MTSRRTRALILAGSAIFTAVFFINFCNLVYQCGCQSLWAGAETHCNIHQPGPHRCPFCTIGPIGGASVFFAIVASQAVPALLWPGRSLMLRTLLTLGAFPLSGGILALALGLAQGYWS